MRRFSVFMVLIVYSLLLFGCDGDGSAKDTLQNCARALEANDASAFLAQFDMKYCAISQIKNMTNANDALHTLDRLGRTLGIGGMDDLLGNVFDVEHSLRKNLGKKASTGELVQECSRSEKTGCPWVPTSLRSAKLRVLSKTSVVARVVSPTQLTTWVALAKRGEKWVIVGWADLEDVAAQFAEQAQEGKSEKKTKKQDSNTVI